jgi:hypothetical protein
VEPLIKAGWDPVPAYLYRMLEESSSGNPTRLITQERFIRWGQRIQFYNGATQIFDRLQKHARSVNPDIGVEFYLISSGIRETLKATCIARHFHDIWACDFEYGAEGRIVFPRNIMSLSIGILNALFANKKSTAGRVSCQRRESWTQNQELFGPFIGLRYQISGPFAVSRE